MPGARARSIPRADSNALHGGDVLRAFGPAASGAVSRQPRRGRRDGLCPAGRAARGDGARGVPAHPGRSARCRGRLSGDVSRPGAQGRRDPGRRITGEVALRGRHPGGGAGQVRDSTAAGCANARGSTGSRPRQRRNRRPRSSSAELRSIMAEELGRLPARFQAPVVICDLQGASHDEAARRLGVPVGTVKSRLARARARLRDRLARRGLSTADLSNRRTAPCRLAATAPGAKPRPSSPET